MPVTMNIEIDDLSRSAIHALLNGRLQSMHELSPSASVHALDLAPELLALPPHDHGLRTVLPIAE